MGWPNNYVQGVYDETGNVIGLVSPSDGGILYINSELVIQSAIHTIIPSSGSISTVGALTLTTALPQIYSSCYMYFPANAVGAASTAGYYYTEMTTLSAGTVFLDTYTTGIPSIPTSKTSVTAGGGAYTQSTSVISNLLKIPVPANSMGRNGSIEISAFFQHSNSAGIKNQLVYFGAMKLLDLSPTTTVASRYLLEAHNVGQTNIQCAAGNTGGAAASPTITSTASIATGSEETLNPVDLKIQGQLITAATDFIILSFARISVRYGS